jgi:Ca2+-binding RTX toxin-like protein
VTLTGFTPQFITPIELNAIALTAAGQSTRLAIGGTNSVFESTNAGTAANTASVNWTQVATGTGVTLGAVNTMAYGGRRNGVDNADVLYVGSGSNVFARTTAGGTLNSTSVLPFGVENIKDIVLDRDDWSSAFVIDDNQVFRTTDTGLNWNEITGTLPDFFTDLKLTTNDLKLNTLEFIAGTFVDALVVGSSLGVFAAISSDFTDWFEIGTDLPNIPVWDFDYDPTDNLLVAGTLGRGAWSFTNVRDTLVDFTQIGTDKDDNLVGTDIITGQTGDDLLNGAIGDDSLSGNEGNDTLIGASGNDILEGGSGNDHIDGGAGTDTVSYKNDPHKVTVNLLTNQATDAFGGTDGFRSIENVIGSAFDDHIIGDAHNNKIEGDSGNDNINGGDGFDTLIGGVGNDTIYGEAGNDTIYGGVKGYSHSAQDNDYLYGEDGNDLIYAQDGEDLLNGETGDDSLFGGAGNDQLYGEVGTDHLDGGTGDDLLKGGTGNDQLYGRNGRDRLFGNEGNDYLDGGKDDDLVYGNDDDDSLYGGLGNDSLKGGNHNDYLNGQNGNDYLYGQNGQDKIEGGIGNDLLLGGNDIDELYGQIGLDYLDGGDGNDYLDGGQGNDKLYGQLGDDRLFGGDGNDYLDGGQGNDKLYGQSGHNTLNGGNGQDSLYGGNGQDIFELSLGAGKDFIFDFVKGQDSIQLIKGLTFADLQIFQGKGTDASDTFIKAQSGNNILAVLDEVQANTINRFDFITSA